MISRNNTRKALFKALEESKARKEDFKFEMTTFRHAIFKVVDLCRALVSCSFFIDEPNKLTICYLFFKSRSIKCSYDYTTKTVDVEVYEGIISDEMDMNILVVSRTVTCDELPAVIKEYQPKTKLVLKKKNA